MTDHPQSDAIDLRGLSGERNEDVLVALESLHRQLVESRLREEALQGSLQLVQQLADAGPQGEFLFELRQDGWLALIGANRAAGFIFQKETDELIGKSLEEALPSLAQSGVTEALRLVARDGLPFNRRTLNLEQDQAKERYQADAYQPSVGRALLLLERITDQANLNDEVRKLLRAVEQSPASIVITDTSGTIEYVNPAFTKASGYSVAEAIGQNPRILKSGNQPPDVYKQLWATISSGNEWKGEFLNKKKNGELYWELASISPIKDTTGRTTHYLGIKEDVTQRKRAEEALRNSEDSLRVIFNSVYDAIFIHELNGTIIDSNEKGLQLFGITRQQSLSMSLSHDLSSVENPIDELPSYWKRAVLGENQFFEWKAKRPADGVAFDVEIFLRRIDLRGKKVILSTIREITERKRMQEQLYQSQRLESIASVVGSIAHEFNNTLNNVLGFAGLIRKYGEDKAKVAKYSAAIEQSVMKSSDLGNRLLSFAKQSRRESAPIDIEALVGEISDRAQKSMGSSVKLETRIDPQILKVLGDRQELIQAVQNLVTNAREAIAARKVQSSPGFVLLAADNSTVSEDGASKLMLPAGSPCVVIRVSDNGVGIPETIRDRIFDPFVTTKERKKGTGLGLSIAFSAVRGHRGTILVETEPDRGSTFKIFLPAIDSKKMADAGSTRKKQGGELILLVDDEEAMREIGTEILQAEGYRVKTASNGLEAIEIYKKQGKSVELVVLDLVMPKMDGGQTYLELKRINPGIKCVFCTGFASDAIITQLLAEENIPAIQKPFRDTEFLQVVHEVLRRTVD
jgi:nitrogen fixation negative regulator NifL